MIIDWQRINSFADPDSPEDQEWLKGMIQDLITDNDEKMSHLQALIQDPKQEELRALLHQIKGVCANFGIVKMQSAAAEGEKSIKESKLDAGLNFAKELPALWKEAKEELSKKYS